MMSLSKVKNHLRVDGTANDDTIEMMKSAAEEYLKDKLKIETIPEDNNLMALYICERVKASYYPDYENSRTQEIMLKHLIDVVDEII